MAPEEPEPGTCGLGAGSLFSRGDRSKSRALSWGNGRCLGLPGGACCLVLSSSLLGAQCQGDDEAQNQQEHGYREQHRDDHHAPRPGHSQPNRFCLPSCQKRGGRPLWSGAAPILPKAPSLVPHPFIQPAIPSPIYSPNQPTTRWRDPDIHQKHIYEASPMSGTEDTEINQTQSLPTKFSGAGR